MIWVCKKCDLTWYYPIKECIYCRGRTTEIIARDYTVKGVTEVFTPSLGHSQVPYLVLLLEDDDGNLYIQKSLKRYELGDRIRKEAERKIQPPKMGVIGTGVMSRGITEVAVQAGCKVVLKSRSKKALKSALEKIGTNLLKVMTTEEKDEMLSNIIPTTNFSELAKVDIIIESVIENLDIKKKVFKRLNKVCSESTILATNTSSLSINELATTVSNPSKFLGIHFFNPVPKMSLVEIVRGKNTSPETIEFAKNFVYLLNKIPIVVKDTPGFIVNRILMPYLNEAVRALDEGASSPEEIDTAAQLGLNHPIGPLALLDLIGLDVFVEIMKNLHQKTRNKEYTPSRLVEKMVEEGKLGRKTKIGFYKY